MSVPALSAVLGLGPRHALPDRVRGRDRLAQGTAPERRPARPGDGRPGGAQAQDQTRRRLLGNFHLQQEQPLFYAAMAKRLLRQLPRPVLLLDWTKAVDGFYALVAALPVDGRALPLYTQVHPKKKQGNRRVHRQFLHTLAALVPPGCRPIVVMDAGFGSHVWQMIQQELDWDFVVRIRGIVQVCPDPGTDWIAATSLYAHATATPADVGRWTLCRSGAQGRYRLVQIKQPPQPRHRWRKAPRSGTQKSAKAAAKEPWLLATSLETATGATASRRHPPVRAHPRGRRAPHGPPRSHHRRHLARPWPGHRGLARGANPPGSEPPCGRAAAPPSCTTRHRSPDPRGSPP